MTEKTKLWQAVGMLPEDLLTEAMTYEKRKGGSMKRILITAAAAVLALSLIGWAAQMWVFAPGQGLVSADALGNKTVYIAADGVMLGNTAVDAVVFLRDHEKPAESRLQVWVYRDTETDTSRDGRIPASLKSMTAVIDGVTYRNDRGRIASQGYSCYTYVPEEGAYSAAETDSVAEINSAAETDICVATLSDMGTDPVELTLHPADGQRLLSCTANGMTISLLTLTENLYIGSFRDTALDALTPDPDLMTVSGFFEAVFADGKTGRVSGQLYYAGEGSGLEFLYLDWDHRGQDVVSMACTEIMVDMAVNGDRYTEFSLPEAGETVTPDHMVLWQAGDFTCTLEKLTWTGSSMRSEALVHYTGDNPCIQPAGGGAMLHFGCLLEGEYVSLSMEDGEIAVYDRERNRIIIEPGDSLVLYAESVDIGYRNPDGTALAEFVFD